MFEKRVLRRIFGSNKGKAWSVGNGFGSFYY
jgi:hypothetical protein